MSEERMDTRPDYHALQQEVLGEVPETLRPRLQQIFEDWAVCRRLSAPVAVVEVIVHGQAWLTHVEDETFRELRDRALAATDHDRPPYRPAGEWDLRDWRGASVDLDRPARSLSDEGWPRLWLNPRAGVGA